MHHCDLSLPGEVSDYQSRFQLGCVNLQEQPAQDVECRHGNGGLQHAGERRGPGHAVLLRLQTHGCVDRVTCHQAAGV